MIPSGLTLSRFSAFKTSQPKSGHRGDQNSLLMLLDQAHFIRLKFFDAVEWELDSFCQSDSALDSVRSYEDGILTGFKLGELAPNLH